MRIYKINNLFLLLGLFFISLSSCLKEENKFAEFEYKAAVVHTSSATNLAANSATVSGEIVSPQSRTMTRGVCWSTMVNPSIVDNKAYQQGKNGAFSMNLTGLATATKYYVRAFATDTKGTIYGDEQSFTTLATLSTITTVGVNNITSTTATSGGTITSDGGSFIMSRGVCWSTSGNPTILLLTKTVDGTGTGSFSSSITGLSPATTYYIRAYATNNAGTVYATQQTFTTAPTNSTLTTNSVTNITSISATCGGNITSDGGAAITARGVCWSATANPTIANSKTTDGTGIGAFTSSITGLIAGTTYYVRAYSTNSVGTVYGVQQSFTTLAVYSTVSTASISSITATSVACGGNVTSDGGATVTAKGVCWGTSSSPTISNSKTVDGSGVGSFSTSISGLSPGTTYYVRAYATTIVGTSYGAESSFTTLATSPTISTNSISSVSTASASCGGNITSDGGAAVTSRGVCWSTTSSPTISNSKVTNGSGVGLYICTITGLTSGTTYYVRAFATNSVGTAYGSEVSFTTATSLSLPTISTTLVNNITTTSATSGGNITSDGGAAVTARGVCWSVSSTPTINNSKTLDGSGTGVFTSSITGLKESTTYYLRAYATNGMGTAYGAELTFNSNSLTGNLLVNPSFESWTAGKPDSWSITTAANGVISEGISIFNDGLKSVKIAPVSGTYSLTQPVPVTPGKTYSLKLWYYIESGDGTDCRIWSNFKTTSGKYWTMTLADSLALKGPNAFSATAGYFPDVKGVWQTYTYDIVAPAGYDLFELGIRSYRSTTTSAIVYWDNIYFGEKK